MHISAPSSTVILTICDCFILNSDCSITVFCKTVVPYLSEPFHHFKLFTDC